jgi:oxygen-independent coproporphyrinogen-3 oxidase
VARALYIHWPFCASKCPYCDFNSHVRAQIDVEAWRDGLLADLRHEARQAAGSARDPQPLTSIFFGGGTPSLMPVDLLDELLRTAERLWSFDPQIEITLEANPTSFEAARFAGFAKAGVNRVSIGVQSLDPQALAFLGRTHSVDTALRVITQAQALFGRVTFDLIYALPGQSAEDWQAQLSRALAFGTNHLSLYQLTIEPNTRFATDVRRHLFTPMEDDAAADLFAVTRELTTAAGLPAYEISNHARPGEESRHNLAYWRYQDYCGIGPGAHGRRDGYATKRVRKPENWLAAIKRQAHGIDHTHKLSAAESATEALLMGLRLAEGIDPALLAARFRLPEDALLDRRRVELYRELGFVWTGEGRVGVTPAGMPVLDSIIGDLVPAGLAAG